jgi:hypothetical protein
MITFNLDIHIHRPIGQVFEYVTLPANNNRWQDGTFEAASMLAVANGAGSIFQTLGHFMGRRMLSTFEVIDFETNRKYGFKSISGPAQIRTLFQFKMDGLFTRILVHTQMESKNYFQASEQITARKLKKQFKENLERLKEILETKNEG